MPIYETLIYAKCPHNGDIQTYKGQAISANSEKEAREYCDNNGFGYLHIGDEIIRTVDSNGNTMFKDNYLN